MNMEHWVLIMRRENGDLYGIVGPFPSKTDADMEWNETQSLVTPREVRATAEPVYQPVMFGGKPLIR